MAPLGQVISWFSEHRGGWGERKAARMTEHLKREWAFDFLILTFDFQACEVQFCPLFQNTEEK